MIWQSIQQPLQKLLLNSQYTPQMKKKGKKSS